MKPPLPPVEAARLQALRQYDVLDTAPEQEFDDLTHLAAQICGTPLSAITFIDQDRQWFKSVLGLSAAEMPRELSFCTHTILEDDLLVVPDVLKDERFSQNPVVTGEPHIRFYAGVPLVTPEGQPIGSLCVIDTVPRQLDQTQQDALRRLARHTIALLEARPDTALEKRQSRQARQQSERQRLVLVAATARQDAENLKVSEERYRRLFEAAKDGILILDAETGRIEDVNPFLCQLLGYTANDFLNKQLWEISTFRDIVANQDAFQELQKTEYIRYEHLPLETKDGKSVSVEFVSNVYMCSEKKVIQCNIRDTNESRQAAAAVQDSQILLQSTLDALAAHIAVLDEDGKIIVVNKAWSQFAEENGGTAASCGVGAPYLDFCNQATGTWLEEVPSMANSIQQVMASPQKVVCFEYPCHGPSEERWFKVCVTRFVSQRSVRVVISHENVTARTQAERALQKANDDLELRVLERIAELGQVNESLRIENVQHQVTMGSLRQVAEALQVAKEEADIANAAKSAFLSRMSHELRTPLNAILGFGQILDRQDLSPLSKESVSYILKGGRHLLDLINEVLDIARVEAGRLELSLKSVSFTEVVSEVCALLQPMAAARNIQLNDNTLRSGCSHIMADRQQFKQVLLNLVSNAIKYNREGGLAQVSCEQKLDGWVSLAVHDTGPGISPQDLPKLFTPFERLSASSSDIEGTGLGLVLSQRMVMAMGGTLGVESTLGQGTTFTIGFPQATSPDEEPTNLPVSTQPSDMRHEGQNSFCVLSIEDNPSHIRLLELIFRDRPEITLLTAMQGSVGLDLARQHEPDLILLDLNLPDIQGKDVLTRLQQSALTRDIPVVVISADATPPQVERLLSAGAKACLTKPLDIDQFHNTVDKFFQMPPLLSALTIATPLQDDEEVA